MVFNIGFWTLYASFVAIGTFMQVLNVNNCIVANVSYEYLIVATNDWGDM